MADDRADGSEDAGRGAVPGAAERVPVAELVDLDALAAGGRAPTPRELRAALPPGWVLDADGRTARRDLRLLFRHGWVLVIGLVAFGAAGLGLFYTTFPRGVAGLARFAGLVVVLLLAGGFVGPMISRSLQRRAEKSPR